MRERDVNEIMDMVRDWGDAEITALCVRLEAIMAAAPDDPGLPGRSERPQPQDGPASVPTGGKA